MPKDLKTILSKHGYIPKSTGDKDFEKVHTLKIVPLRGEVVGKTTASGDEIFSASRVKVSPRPGKSAKPDDVGDESVSESVEVTSTIVEAPKEDNKWWHEDQFRQHSSDAVSAHDKHRYATNRSATEKDKTLKTHYGELADIYKKAAHHHLKLAACHAKHCGIKEEVNLDELSHETLGAYVKKALPAGRQGAHMAAYKRMKNIMHNEPATTKRGKEQYARTLEHMHNKANSAPMKKPAYRNEEVNLDELHHGPRAPKKKFTIKPKVVDDADAKNPSALKVDANGKVIIPKVVMPVTLPQMKKRKHIAQAHFTSGWGKGKRLAKYHEETE